MVDDLITKVISVEDIPAAVATELVTLFNMMVKRTPQIFPVSNEKRNIRKYLPQRFKSISTFIHV